MKAVNDQLEKMKNKCKLEHLKYCVYNLYSNYFERKIEPKKLINTIALEDPDLYIVKKKIDFKTPLRPKAPDKLVNSNIEMTLNYNNKGILQAFAILLENTYIEYKNEINKTKYFNNEDNNKDNSQQILKEQEQIIHNIIPVYKTNIYGFTSYITKKMLL